ncbi:AAA family ATPase [Fusobacterium varium]|uniref:AAA family ATPase n=1 Tax=Fusobacterium varium TaxID=856 RepID=UPI00266C2392|nr:AAA family ATPase [Fusobacterium varium]
MIVKNLEIKNFKGIKNLEIKDLKKINFFVGGNNSKKTTILEAISLMNKNNSKNIRMIIKNVNYGDTLDILDSFYHNFNMELNPEISIENVSGEIEKFKISKSMKGIKETDEEENTISEYQVYINDMKDIRIRYNGKNTTYYYQSQKKVEKNIIYIPANRKIVNIAELVSSLQKNKKIDEIVENLQIYDSNLEGIYADGKKVYVNLKILKKSLTLESMGEGFISALVIASNLVSDNENENKIILIDEIENGLYKTSLKNLIEFILKIMEKSNIQLFITSHSKEFLKEFYNLINPQNNDTKVYKMRGNKNSDETFVKEFAGEEVKELLKEGWDVR